MSAISIFRKIFLLATIILSGCGGGDENSKNTAPNIVIFFVSGHTKEFDGNPSTSYLNLTVGPSIVADIKNSGYTVEESYYVDDALPQVGFGGFQDLVASMRTVRDKYISQGTRVVVIAHSHGGVWAHAAIRQVSDLPITAEVDLDTSSYGWSIVSHNLQNSFIGGDPRDEFTINFLSSYSQYNVPSDTSSSYDIEDVVFPNVKSALEVRSGEMAPLGLEWYDEKWNIRENGTTTNLYGYFSNTSHTEVHQPGGSTIAFVKNWLRTRLSGTP